MLIQKTTAQTTRYITISSFAFQPQYLIVYLGDTVVWTNDDPVIHTLWFTRVSDGSTYLLSDPIPPYTTWTNTFNEPVELQYYSFDKLWITGFINVTGETHDIAVTDVSLSKTIVGQGYSMHIDVTTVNQGDFSETFNVTVYANTTIIETKEVTLASGASTTIATTWNTSGFAYGNYTIWAYAWPVPGETDTANNILFDGWVVVTITGDVNGDGTVDIYDLILVASAFGAQAGDPGFSPNADINGDNTIDIYDLIPVASHFGETIP
jgi:hypothetical protein